MNKASKIASQPAALSGIAAFAGRLIFQIAFVVKDLEQALARYSALLPAGGWRCWTFGSKDHERCDNRGRPAEFSNRLALNDQSPQLELIQPLSLDPPFDVAG